jgi:hypothetical protein
MIVSSTVTGAAGGALLFPALNAAWNNALPDGERAKLSSLWLLVTAVVRLPMGWVSGVMYDANPKLPFAVGIVLTVVCLCAVLMAGGRRNADHHPRTSAEWPS